MGVDIESMLLEEVREMRKDMVEMKIRHQSDMGQLGQDIAILKQRSATKAAIWGGVSGGLTLFFGSVISYFWSK